MYLVVRHVKFTLATVVSHFAPRGSSFALEIILFRRTLSGMQTREKIERRFRVGKQKMGIAEIFT
jgi:hypothetical protein